MNKIFWFEEWTKGFKNYPFPTKAPFEKVSFYDEEKLKEADAFVQIDIKPRRPKNHRRDRFYDYISSTGKPKLVFESHIFRQVILTQRYSRFAWNSYFNNVGYFGKLRNNPDRWKKFIEEEEIDIREPTQKKGDYILILTQPTYGSCLNDLFDLYADSARTDAPHYDRVYAEWLHRLVQYIQRYSELPIIIRRHPAQKDIKFFNIKYFDNVYYSENTIGLKLEYGNSYLRTGGKHLTEEILGSQAVVSWNSTGLVEAVCLGIPTFPLSPSSQCYPVGFRDLHDIDVIHRKKYPKRDEWFNNMAYCQWTDEEVKRGTAFRFINDGYKSFLGY